ncbi:serine/threonine-protein kinase VRK1-like [Apostichopus japonicus]|uniref:serine/threonine-protein kinase VRK1-like n=1 Tax=Stichopus japonicus TaxID=307972 RepID=UPI003AB11302
MPRAAKAAGDKPAPKKRKGIYQMPDPLPLGEELTDFQKKKWALGPSVGKGGFGEIYLASEVKEGKPQENPSHVIKIEPRGNGPLFCELHFYQRAAKPDMIKSWKKKQKLKHLGVPSYITAGIHKDKRFLVMDRFGEDLWNLFLKSGKKFSPKAAYTIGIQMVDALEYVHDQGYVHADIKGSNILLGFEPKAKDQVFLVDFGLVSKYMGINGHNVYKPDPKKAHEGTLEYTSIGAHEGISSSRRHDFEILGYNLVQWMSGDLPWSKVTKETEVQAIKVKHSKDRNSFLQLSFKEQTYPTELRDYFNYVDKIAYEEKPNYSKIKALFKKGIVSSGEKFDGKLQFVTPKKENIKAINTPRKSPMKSPVKPAKNTKKPAKRNSDSSETAETPAKKRTKRKMQTEDSSSDARSPSPQRNPEKKPISRAAGGKAKTNQRNPGSKKVKTLKRLVASTTIATQTSPGLKGLRRTRKKAGKRDA